MISLLPKISPRESEGLGEYDDIELAAQAYRDAAIKYHGEFAHF